MAMTVITMIMVKVIIKVIILIIVTVVIISEDDCDSNSDRITKLFQSPNLLLFF